MSEHIPKIPSLSPSFPLGYKQTSRVIANAPSPEPHRGWHSRGYLPHWDHPGLIQSLNFRLGDSLPDHGIIQWKQELVSQPETRRSVELRRRVEDYLDAGYGECLLSRPELAQLVEEALFHFDPERYRLLAWCVMPNHVHALIETKVNFPLGNILHSWKSYLTHEMNKILGRHGELWQREYADRYIRNAEHFETVVNYIEENPVKAHLIKTKVDWPYSSARFRSPGSAGVSPASC